jgi:hypothetical protein
MSRSGNQRAAARVFHNQRAAARVFHNQRAAARVFHNQRAAARVFHNQRAAARVFQWSAAVLLVWTAACAPRLETPNDGPDGGTSLVINEDMGDGVTITRVDATDEELWVYFDFDTMAAVEPDTPEMSQSWDLGFRRFRIKLNGGVTGTGGVAMALVTGVAFADLSQAPADGYISDLPDNAEDEDLEPEYVMSEGETAWFDYSPTTHVLTLRDHVYVVRSVENIYYKMQIIAYYDDAGSPAYVRFQWSQIPGPTGDS